MRDAVGGTLVDAGRIRKRHLKEMIVFRRDRPDHGGKRIALAIDEEDQAQSANEEQTRRGRPHAGISIYDVSNYSTVKPLSLFEVSELDSPWSRAAPGRFGAHQFRERMDGTLVYCAWFAGGLRITDSLMLHPNSVVQKQIVRLSGQQLFQLEDFLIGVQRLISRIHCSTTLLC